MLNDMVRAHTQAAHSARTLCLPRRANRKARLWLRSTHTATLDAPGVEALHAQRQRQPVRPQLRLRTAGEMTLRLPISQVQ